MASNTWKLTPLLNNRYPSRCNWVFHTKLDATGHVVQYKARLVEKSFAQAHEINFHETFAPVAKFTMMRCILAIRAGMDLEIHQMDVKTVFLNVDFEEDIYMVQSEGFVQQGKKIMFVS